MSADGENGNGRITWAVVNQRLMQIDNKLSHIENLLERQDSRTGRLESDMAVSANVRGEINRRLGEHDDELETLKKTNALWSGLNSTISIIAAAFAAALGLGNK